MYRDLGTRYGLGFELSLVRNQVKTVKRLKAALDSGDEAGIGRLSKKLRGLLFQSESMLPEHEVEVLSKVDLLRKLTLPEEEQTVSIHRIVDEDGQVRWVEVEKGSLAYGKNGIFVGDVSNAVKGIVGAFEEFDLLEAPDVPVRKVCERSWFEKSSRKEEGVEFKRSTHAFDYSSLLASMRRVRIEEVEKEKEERRKGEEEGKEREGKERDMRRSIREVASSDTHMHPLPVETPSSPSSFPDDEEGVSDVPWRLYEEALGLEGRGRFEESVCLWKELLVCSGSTSLGIYLHYHCGFCQVMQGNWSEGAFHLRRVLAELSNSSSSSILSLEEQLMADMSFMLLSSLYSSREEGRGDLESLIGVYSEMEESQKQRQKAGSASSEFLRLLAGGQDRMVSMVDPGGREDAEGLHVEEIVRREVGRWQLEPSPLLPDPHLQEKAEGLMGWLEANLF